MKPTMKLARAHPQVHPAAPPPPPDPRRGGSIDRRAIARQLENVRRSYAVRPLAHFAVMMQVLSELLSML